VRGLWTGNLRTRAIDKDLGVKIGVEETEAGTWMDRGAAGDVIGEQ